AAVPGQRPQRQPAPPSAPAAGGRRPGARRASERGLLVYRATAGGGAAAGVALDPASAGLLAAARAGDGLDLELAPARANLWIHPAHPAQPDALGPMVVRASLPGHDRPRRLHHG